MAFATAHNGGKYQTNWAPPVWNGGWILANGLKSGQGLFIHPNNQDTNGYPNVFPVGGGSYQSVTWIPSQAMRPGVWHWVGIGKGTVSGGSDTYTSTVDGSWQSPGFTPPEDASSLDLPAWNGYFHMGGLPGNRVAWSIDARGTTSYISKLALIHQDDLTTYLAGDRYTARARTTVQAAKPGIIRSIDLQYINASTQATWSDHPTPDFITTQGRFRKECWAGTATQAVAGAYTASQPTGWAPLGNGNPPHGALVHLDFGSVGSTTGNTVKIGGGNAKPLLTSYGTTFNSAPGPTPVDARQGGAFNSLIYDEVIGGWLWVAGEFANMTVGMSLDTFFRFCAEEGIHPWFHIPHHACHPVTDWVDSALQLIKTYTDACSWMEVYIEPSNEVWNYAFQQTSYAQTVGNLLPVVGGLDGWYARACANIGKRMNAILGTSRSRYHLMNAVQTDWNRGHARFIGGNETGNGNDPNDRGIDYIQGMAYASYWEQEIRVDQLEADYAFEYSNPATTLARRNEIGDTVLGSYPTTLQNVIIRCISGPSGPSMPNWKGWLATNYPTKSLETRFYEGGFATYEWFGGSNEAVMNIASVAKDSATQITVTLRTDGDPRFVLMVPVGGRVLFGNGTPGNQTVELLAGMTQLNGQFLTCIARDVTLKKMTFTTANNSTWGTHTANTGACRLFASYDRPAAPSTPAGGPMTFQDAIFSLAKALHSRPALYAHTISFNNRLISEAGGLFPSAYGFTGPGPWQKWFPSEYAPLNQTATPELAAFVAFNTPTAGITTTARWGV